MHAHISSLHILILELDQMIMKKTIGIILLWAPVKWPWMPLFGGDTCIVSSKQIPIWAL